MVTKNQFCYNTLYEFKDWVNHKIQAIMTEIKLENIPTYICKERCRLDKAGFHYMAPVLLYYTLSS